MTFSTFDNLLWAAGFLGHVALFLILVIRKRWREFPIFTGMIGYQALVTIALFQISRVGNHHAYFLTYWISALGDYGFQVALIFEIGRMVLRPTGTWVQDARFSFLLWGSIGTVLAAGLAWAASPPGAAALDLWEVRATVFTSLLTCELVLAMSSAATRLGLPWRSHVMALGQGLAAWAAVALMGDLAHVTFGWKRDFIVFDHMRMLVYLGSLIFWMVSFWLAERERGPMSTQMRDYLVALHSRVQYDLQRTVR